MFREDKGCRDRGDSHANLCMLLQIDEVRLHTVNNQRTYTIFIVQHAQMLVVRKEGKAHDQYNSFRSAFELMEAVGREPSDAFDLMADDLPPLEMLEKRMTCLLYTSPSPRD